MPLAFITDPVSIELLSIALSELIEFNSGGVGHLLSLDKLSKLGATDRAANSFMAMDASFSAFLAQ